MRSGARWLGWLSSLGNQFRKLAAEPAVLPAGAFIAGIAAARVFSPAPLACLAALSITLALFAACNRSLTLLAFLFTAGASLLSLHDAHDRAVPFLATFPDGDGVFVTAEGTVAGLPSEDPRTGRTRFPLRLRAVSTDDGRFTAAQTVLAVVPGGMAGLTYGDIVRIDGLLRHPRRARNPGEFDERSFLRQRGIHAEIVAGWPDDLVLSGKGGGHPVIAASLSARRWISNALMRDLEDEPRATVLRAVVLGERVNVPWQISEDFRLSGTMHIFAVSGLHVGLLGYLVFELLRAAGLPRRAAILGVIVTVIFYAFVTGLRPSAVRAALMTAVFLGGVLANRQARILNSLGTAALVILLVDPLQLFRPGFQLSFVVLLSIALLAPVLRSHLRQWIKPDPFLPLPLMTPRQLLLLNTGGSIADYFAVALAAWLGSAPLILAYFHLISPIALVANIFIVPVAFVILFASLASLVLTAVRLPALAVIVNNASYALASLMVLLVGVFAGVPGGHFFVPWESLFDRNSATIVALDVESGAVPAVVHGEGRTGVLGEARSREDRRAIRAYGRSRGYPELLPLETAGTDAWTPIHEDHPAAGLLEIDGWRVLFLGGLGFNEEKDLLENRPRLLKCDVLVKGVRSGDLSGLPGTISVADPKVIVLGQSRVGGGDPHQSALRDRLVEEGRNVLYQPETGAVKIEIKGDRLTIGTQLGGKRIPFRRE